VAEELRVPGFWPLQAASWALFYALILLPVLPHLHEPGILAYNTWAVLLLFCASVALRPALRYGSSRWQDSWLRLEGFAFALCFAAGAVATFLTALFTFGVHEFRWSSWTLSGVQCAMVLFLWATLYLSARRWRDAPGKGKELCPPDSVQGTEAVPFARPYRARFTSRVGSRLQIVSPDEILWIAAARDYAELHTGTSVHLLRETLTSLQGELDPTRFLRIHRSRIVRADQIVELVALDNSDYTVKLRDGSEHRSSRTYAPALVNWLRSSTHPAG
jgi:hypothetical protein